MRTARPVVCVVAHASEAGALSVHGEYARSLEGLIDCLGALDLPDRGDWIARFEAGRVDRHPDLSTAARASRAALEALEAAHGAPTGTDAADWLPRIAEAHAHLLAHVRIILGEPR